MPKYFAAYRGWPKNGDKRFDPKVCETCGKDLSCWDALNHVCDDHDIEVQHSYREREERGELDEFSQRLHDGSHARSF